MDLTIIKGKDMKRVVFALTLIGFTSVNALDINNLKWTQDYEMLVGLSGEADNNIEGVDQNGNGIRDDVEFYIENKYKNRPFQKAMFKEAAKKMQEILLLDTKDVKKHKELDRELLNIYTCRDYILYKLETPNIEKEMEDKTLFKAKVLNTNKRLQTYISHKKLLPLDFEDLSTEQLKKDKDNCQRLYAKFTNQDIVTSN
jgi:hypothetical protein